MDINKDQQVNTFLKGMNTDLSDALIDNSQYRYAENIRVTTNTEHNTGEARLIEGNVKISDFDDKDIIYINSIRDYVAVVCQDSNGWSVYVSPDKCQSWKLIFGPCTDLLSTPISGVLRYESENNIKLYICDGTHVIIPLWIDQNHTEGDVSTDIHNLIGYQDTFLDAPVVTLSNNAGHLKPAKVQYVYRLYRLGGAATTLSPLSNVISLYKNNSEGYSDKEITNKATVVRIKFDNVKALDRIQLFRITYAYNGQVPTIEKIEDKEIDTSQEHIDIEDFGDSQEQYGVDELLGLTQMQIQPKIIESKGDTMFAANVRYIQDDVDKLFEKYETRSFSSGNYWKLPSAASEGYVWDDNNGVWRAAASGTSVTEQPITFNLSGDTVFRGGTLNEPPKNAELCHRQFNSGDNYTYNEKYWRPINEAANGSEPAAFVSTEIGGKGPNINWRLESQQVLVSKTGWDDSFDRNYYKCDETYRFGAILYNDKNQASSVKWIADIRIPPRTQDDYTFENGNCYVKMYKIKFFIKKFPDRCKAIQIVQSPRRFEDRRVITQGIVGAPMQMYKNGSATNYICPSGIMSLQQMHANNNNSNVSTDDMYKREAFSMRDVIQFASPEYAYQADDIKNVLSTYKSQIQVQHVVAFKTPGVHQTIDNIPTVRSNPSIAFRFYKSVSSNRIIFDMNYSNLFDEKDDGIYGGNQWHNVNRNSDGNYLKLETFGRDDDDCYFGYTSFNHVVPSDVLTDSQAEIMYPSNISTIAYPSVPEWNKFADGDRIRFMDDTTAVGTYSYVNWSYPLCLDASGAKTGELAKTLIKVDDIPDDHGQSAYLYPVGTGGKCMLIKFDRNYMCVGNDGSYRMQNVENTFAPIHVANIIKRCSPYGGYTKQAIQNSTYCSGGDTITKTQFDARTTTDYEIYATGGDSYIGWFKYNANHMWYDPQYITATKMASVYEVPLDMDIDIYAQHGSLYDSTNSQNGYYIQDEPASISNVGYAQEKPAYQYNTAYNQAPNVISYSSVEKTDITNYDWDIRIHNSELKTSGENIDSWLTFKAMNYLDVDSRHGAITDIKLFKDKLIFWQNNAVGVLSSNERTMLNDSDGNQIILGNGGILQRSDYISTVYGMKKDQFVTTQSNTTLYWWDGNNKEILAYSENGILPLASLKGIRNYLNEHDENTIPYMFYDTKNKELVSSVVNNESVVYSEQIEAFSSVYKFMPLYGTTVNGDTLVTIGDRIYKQNANGIEGESYLFGSPITPLIQYVINSQNMFPKVFDIQTFGGRFYGGDNISNLTFDYKTPLKQHSQCTGNSVTNREYDFRLDIPRNNNDSYGGRMRGKTMQCELGSTSNSTDFSIQYITTKYRMSWS